MQDQKVIGIIGGGQLAKNLTLAAVPLGFKVIALEPVKTNIAGQAGAEQIDGNLYDKKAIRKLIKRSDYVTAEIEHLDTKTLAKAAEKGKVKIRPAAQTIELIQDKYKQKCFFKEKNIPLGPFELISSKEDAANMLKKYNSPIMLKTRFGAYNGLGNALVKDSEDLDKAWKKLGAAKLYAEQFIPFSKELAVMAARDVKGKIVLHPIVETIHKRNICQETFAPASIDKTVQKSVESLAHKLLKALDDVGIFGIEMFLTKDNNVLLNEVAPRVHNSGHYTLDACLVSQFEQHIRAITGLPLGSTDLVAPAAVMVNILGERNGPTRIKGLDKALKVSKTAVHIYGKSPTKVDRKLGHINSLGKSVRQARRRARKARKLIDI